jgi:2'-5' RNA ligase
MSIKLFIGTSLGAELVEKIWNRAAPLGARGRWRWSAREQWHLTSLFIGQRDEADLPIVSSAVAHVCKQTGPITLRNGQLTTMPEDRPSMLWVRFSPSVELGALHNALAHHTSTTPSPHRPYWPHITLARGTGSLLEMPDPTVLPSLLIQELTLFRSDPGPEGTVHSALGTWSLGPMAQ